MGHAVFIHRADSIYDDSPAVQYQFPRQYLGRAQQAVGDWIVYYEPTKVALSRGYFATAKVRQIIPDPKASGMYLALIEPDSFLEFANAVPFKAEDGLIERGLVNADGKVSGWAQAAVRQLAGSDFKRIIERGLADDQPILPRVDEIAAPQLPYLEADDEQVPFEYEVERVRTEMLTSRIVRDRVFRKLVLRAYDARCAVTGIKLINGGGRAEVDAAHIRPVEFGGPDIVNNGMALSGTAHWMFDRGLIGIADDLSIVVSRHVNDRDSVDALINRTGKLIGPGDPRGRPHPVFLAWHRENCFKQ